MNPAKEIPAGAGFMAAASNDLGANFEHPVAPPLTFATKSRIWGDPSGMAHEPTTPAFVEARLKDAVLTRDGFRCRYCGFTSRFNEVHNFNDNHNDVRIENLQTADPFCHGWQHLGEIAEGDAAIAYLPGTSPQDINHLQRTIAVALVADDVDLRKDATALLNWLASHRDYAERAWGTHDPAVFADALLRQPVEERHFRELVFEGLGIVFHPRLHAELAANCINESYASYPTSEWGRVHHDIMNAPL